MTRRGGKEASVRRSGIGEDERQPKMARLAALMEAFQFGEIGSA